MAFHASAPALWTASGELLSSTDGAPADACKGTQFAAQSSVLVNEGAVGPPPGVGAPLQPVATTADFLWKFQSTITASATSADGPPDAAVASCKQPVDVSIQIELTYDAASFYEGDLGKDCDL